MKPNWNQTLTTFDGEPLSESIFAGNINLKPRTHMVDGRERPVPLTLGRACINTLLTDRTDENQTGSQKFDRIILAMKIDKGEALTAEEVTLIKERAGKQYTAYAAYQIWTMLEGDDGDAGASPGKD